MKSWAVPKGPSYDPAARRLAMQVEDHPIEYNRFEGTIPKGQYSGGTVMIWDRGTYAQRRAVRMKMAGTRNQWLLIKHRDDYAKPDFDVVALADTSVASGRTMEQIAKRSRRLAEQSRLAGEDR